MTAVAGYIRCSTQRQVEFGLSLETQTERILRHQPTARLFVDGGVSAKSPLSDRPEGCLLLASVEAGDTKTVVAVKLDRLFRSCQQALQTIERWNLMGVNIVVLDIGNGDTLDTRSSMGKFFLTIMAAASELERSLCADRTKSAMAYIKTASPDGWVSKRSGKHTNRFGRPDAWDNADHHAAAMAAVRRLQGSGLTLDECAAVLNQAIEAGAPDAVVPVRGSRWSRSSVWRLLNAKV
jgi:DNA invertase Pin-like site-specific DNA recombinase